MWKEFPFDCPEINLRIEMTSVTIKSFKPFKGWKVRYNVHEYYGPGGDVASVRRENDIEKQRQGPPLVHCSAQPVPFCH